MASRDDRARAINVDIGRVLLRDWDPIGVKDVPEAQDEYDSYIGGVYRLLANGASAVQIAEHLASIEQAMSFSTQPAALMDVAHRLRQLDVRLDRL
jgi:hypothetical protein